MKTSARTCSAALSTFIGRPIATRAERGIVTRTRWPPSEVDSAPNVNGKKSVATSSTGLFDNELLRRSLGLLASSRDLAMKFVGSGVIDGGTNGLAGWTSGTGFGVTDPTVSTCWLVFFGRTMSRPIATNRRTLTAVSTHLGER